MGASNEILSLSKRIEQLEALVQGLATSQVPELEDAMRKIISSLDTLNTQSQEVHLGATQMQERQHALAGARSRCAQSLMSCPRLLHHQCSRLDLGLSKSIRRQDNHVSKRSLPLDPRNHRQLPRFTLRKRSLALDHRNHRWLSEFMNKQRFREQRQCLPS